MTQGNPLTLAALAAEMETIRGTMAWSDFNATCRGGYGFTPQDPRAQDTVVSPEFASYWLEVAAGRSSDYDPEHGERSEKLWADIAAGRTPGYRPGHAGA